MTLNIPQALFDKYREGMDALIDNVNIGVNCTLVYPPKQIKCNNCTVNLIGGISNNIYRHGGPMPFSFGSCPLCGGQGYKEEEITGSIRLRLYWRERDWNMVTSLRVPNSAAMAIGYLSDFVNFRQAMEIIVVSDQKYKDWRMAIAGEPFLHGFGKNRYFASFLKRV